MGFWGLYVLDRDEKKIKRHLIEQKGSLGWRCEKKWKAYGGVKGSYLRMEI